MSNTGQKVIMEFYPDGQTKIAASGYTGQTCLAATQPFEDLFKKQVSERQFVGDDCAPAPGELVRR